MARLKKAREHWELGSVNTFFCDASMLLDWLQVTIKDYHGIVPPDVQNTASLSISIEEPAIVRSCAEFSSVLALAARATAAGLLPSFEEVLLRLTKIAGDKQIVQQAIVTLVGLAPELLGFHLMFWELMIRTWPHD